MNSVLCPTTNVMLNECTFETDRNSMDVALYDEAYATAPIAAVQPPCFGEEELHVLFESAISNRLLAMREKMDRISGPLPHTSTHSYETEAPPVVVPTQKRNLLVFHHRWQRPLLYSSLGLMLTLLGFDLMGLLVLCTR